MAKVRTRVDTVQLIGRPGKGLLLDVLPSFFAAALVGRELGEGDGSCCASMESKVENSAVLHRRRSHNAKRKRTIAIVETQQQYRREDVARG